MTGGARATPDAWRGGRIAPMATRKLTTRAPLRLHVDLSLTRAERRAPEARCAAELRTPGRLATRIVVAHLAERPGLPQLHATARGERVRYAVQVRLTPAQRRELEARAAADGRTLSNYVTAVVVGELGDA